MPWWGWNKEFLGVHPQLRGYCSPRIDVQHMFGTLNVNGQQHIGTCNNYHQAARFNSSRREPIHAKTLVSNSQMAILVRYKGLNYFNVSFLLRTTIIDIVLIS